MLANNLTIKTLKLDLESSEINYDIAWSQFYLPQINLTAASTSTYSFGSLPFSDARNNAELRQRGYPSSGVTLSLGSYTLFNFFRDKATYDLQRLTYERALSRYQENVRSARFQLTSTYFNSKIAQEKLEAAERSVTIAQALQDLIQSRRRLNKSTEDELNSATVDLLNAKVSLLNERKNVSQILIQLNTALNVPPDVEFKLTTEPPFVPVHLDEKNLFSIFKATGPYVKNAELALSSAEMSAALAEKSRLPLPTVSFSGINITYGNTYAGGTAPVYSSGSYGHYEVSAVISLTLPIFGPYGFFNSRAVRLQYINRENSEISHQNTMINGELYIRQKIASIKQLEGQIKTLRESFTKNAQILNSLFSRAANTSTDRLQLRDAILQSRQSELSYLDSLLSHISEKNSLSEYIGIDRLPGDQL